MPNVEPYIDVSSIRPYRGLVVFGRDLDYKDLVTLPAGVFDGTGGFLNEL